MEHTAEGSLEPDRAAEGRMRCLESETVLTAASLQTSSVPKGNNPATTIPDPENNNSKMLSVWGHASLLGHDHGHQHHVVGGVEVDERRRDNRMAGVTESLIEQVWGPGRI